VSTLGSTCVQPTVNYLQYLATGSTLTAVGPFQLTAPKSGTLSQISSGSRASVQSVSDVCLKRTCLLDTSAFSALEVLSIYLLTYLETEAGLTVTLQPIAPINLLTTLAHLVLPRKFNGCRKPLCREPLSSCRRLHSVSVSNLPLLLYLSVACCGSSVHKTGCSLYIYLQHYTTYIHPVSSYTSDHFHRSYPSSLFFSAASARVVLWPIDARGC